MNIYKFVVDVNGSGIRLDKYLTQQFLAIKPEITRSKIQNFCEQNLIFDETDRPVKNLSQKTKINQEFAVKIKDQEPALMKANQVKFDIVFEDDDILVINKPINLTVHPGAGNYQDTLVNGLLFSHSSQLSTINGNVRPGIVHRLDKDTSGLLLVAKNDFTHLKLSTALQKRNINRYYFAFIFGVLAPSTGTINRNIIRSNRNRLKMMASNNDGKIAITHYQTKQIYGNNFASLVECKLETGRTHQIRVHFESIKHSLIGDQLYNSCRKNLVSNNLLELDIDKYNEIKGFVENFSRQALHAYRISFLHPRSEKLMSFEVPFPEDLCQLQNLLNDLNSEQKS